LTPSDEAVACSTRGGPVVQIVLQIAPVSVLNIHAVARSFCEPVSDQRPHFVRLQQSLPEHGISRHN